MQVEMTDGQGIFSFTDEEMQQLSKELHYAGTVCAQGPLLQDIEEALAQRNETWQPPLNSLSAP